MKIFNINEYIEMFEARDSDSLAFKECEKFLDEIYNGSKYSRLFGQFILTKMICHPVSFNCLNNIYLSGFLNKVEGIVMIKKCILNTLKKLLVV